MIDRWLYGRWGFLIVVAVVTLIAGTGFWILLGIAAWRALT